MPRASLPAADPLPALAPTAVVAPAPAAERASSPEPDHGVIVHML